MIISVFLGFILKVTAQDCRTVVELWQAMGKTTYIDANSSTKCCNVPQLNAMCKTNKDGSLFEPVKILSLSWSDANLKGSIPSFVANLTDLLLLDVSRNAELGGNLPKEMGNMTALKELKFYGTQISDYDWIKAQKNFTVFLPPKEDQNKKNALIAGAVIGVIIFLIVVTLVIHYWWKAKVREQQKSRFFSQEALKNISIDSLKK